MQLSQHIRKLVLGTALALSSVSAFAYSVNDGRIIDDQGKTVQLRGVSWFGFDTNNHTVHGLWARNWKEMITQMQSLGFNAVRLPFCPASLHGTAVNSINYSLNPDLQNLNSQQLMDTIIKEISDRGMYVLLDHHTPNCSNITDLWYTGDYSQSQWIDDLRLAAQRYSSVPGVIGIDLKNEPHGSATWGAGNSATDWNTAAEIAAAEVLAKAPHWLVGVQGISGTGNCTGGSNHFWGENLEQMQCKPLTIPKNHLLLIPHVYGPDVYVQPYMNDGNFPNNLAAIWEKHFGFLANQGYALMPGEFGGKYGEGDGRDVKWQNAFVDYLRSTGINSGFYWSWNPNSGDTGGILRDDWRSVRDDKVFLLKTLWQTNETNSSSPKSTITAPVPTPAPTPAPTKPVPAPKPAPTPQPTPTPIQQPEANANVTIRTFKDSDWGAGYCTRFQVVNTGNKTAPWQVSMTISGHVNNLWSGQWSQNGSTLTVSGLDWNKTLAPGAMAEFGYCAAR